MNTETTETTPSSITENKLPSADFVRAISDFLDTDPADLLDELGYYNRSGAEKPAPVKEPVKAATS